MNNKITKTPGVHLASGSRLLPLKSLLIALVIALSGCSVINGPRLEHVLGDMVVKTSDNASGISVGDRVTVRFLGVTTLLISDGETTLLTDGFFSRPGPLAVVFNGQIEPNIERIDKQLNNLGLNTEGSVDAILVTHAHYDHAMDVAPVALRTGATVYGSSSTRMIALGGGVPESRIVTVEPSESIKLGKFEVQFLPSTHFPLKPSRGIDLNKGIDQLLIPPQKLNSYYVGTPWSILIKHPKGSALLHASAGYTENMFSTLGLDVDVLFLGVGLLGTKDADYLSAYWRNVVEGTHPERIFPVHWDDPTRPLDEVLQAIPKIVAGTDGVSLFEDLEKKIDPTRQKLELLPFCKIVSLFDDAAIDSLADQKCKTE